MTNTSLLRLLFDVLALLSLIPKNTLACTFILHNFIISLSRKAPPTSMSSSFARIGSGVRALIRRWESLQVELHGSYSIDRFTSMHKFCESTSVWRALAVLAATPLLPLISMAVVDAVPMKAPDLGLAHSGGLWARGMLVALLVSYASLWQFCQYVTELKVSSLQLVLSSIIAAVVVHVVAICLIMLLWYPLPFTMLWVSGPWIGTLALSLKLTRGEFLRKHAHVQQEVRTFSTILLMQTASAVVYMVFNVIYLSIPAKYHPVAAFGVPVFKITQKNLLCRFLRGKDDVKPEMVIFYVDITCALFVSSIMQQTASINTSVLLILIDIAQMLVSLFDINLMLKSVKDIANKMGICTDEVIANALLIVTKYPELEQQLLRAECLSSSKADTFYMSSLRRTTKARIRFTGTARIGPAPGDVLASSWVNRNVAQVFPVEKYGTGPGFEALEHITSQERCLLLQKTLHILFLTEFLLLSEFVEVLTPVMYGCYLTITFHGPNREFYPQFQGLDETEFWIMIRNTLVYGLLEVGTLVMLLVMIYRTTHRFPLQQLAFVMKSTWRKLQLRLMIWLLLLLQASIPQLGTDYTFKFKWIHKH